MKPVHSFAFTLASILILCSPSFCQKPDTPKSRPYEDLAKQIITTGLSTDESYHILTELCTTIGARLAGSPQAAQAVSWAKRKMEDYGFSNVRLESVTVPHWIRGPKEEASIIRSSGEILPMKICALGGSIATPKDGITARVVEVKSFDELKSLGEDARGRIVFFNRPMDQTKIYPFEAYGGAVNQRTQGAVEAAQVGGVGTIVRSMTERADDVPHTGAMNYVDSIRKVPTAALSIAAANLLDSLLRIDPWLQVKLKLTCQTLPDVESSNVIGEITGTEYPNEIVLVGGHLDSWDKGQGAHDDGTGVSQSIEALRLIKSLGLQPKRTIRVVLFMNEEHGLNGGKAYAADIPASEKHIAAIETDAGGFSPRGFGVSSDSVTFAKIARWSHLLEPMDAEEIRRGGGGADISPLARSHIPMIGLRVDSQRYFDYHHSDSDTIDKVNERELELGATTLAILAYVLAQEGL
jgi:carboxypeptidase Q